jgi:hypothetical protein
VVELVVVPHANGEDHPAPAGDLRAPTDVQRLTRRLADGMTELDVPDAGVALAWSTAVSDLAALPLGIGEGPAVPIGGLPIYQSLFGRDMLTTGWQALLATPEVLRDALRTNAAHVGTRIDDWRDEQPGKMLHHPPRNRRRGWRNGCWQPTCSPAGASARWPPHTRPTTRSATTSGSVWSVEQATMAAGFGRYGLIAELHQLARGFFFDLAGLFEDHRIPESVGGTARDEAHPHLPEWLPTMTLRKVRLGHGSGDLYFWRDRRGKIRFRGDVPGVRLVRVKGLRQRSWAR